MARSQVDAKEGDRGSIFRLSWQRRFPLLLSGQLHGSSRNCPLSLGISMAQWEIRGLKHARIVLEWRWLDMRAQVTCRCHPKFVLPSRSSYGYLIIVTGRVKKVGSASNSRNQARGCPMTWSLPARITRCCQSHQWQKSTKANTTLTNGRIQP